MTSSHPSLPPSLPMQAAAGFSTGGTLPGPSAGAKQWAYMIGRTRSEVLNVMLYVPYSNIYIYIQLYITLYIACIHSSYQKI